jgi:hypothetical protein
MTMETVSIIAAVIALYLALLGFKGNRVIRCREEFIRSIKESDNTEIQYLGRFSYQGGLLEIPTPQKLNVAVAKDYILLFTNKARYGKVQFCCCKQIETFVTRTKQNRGRQSIIMWSPLSNFLNKETFRHFIVINYTDSEGQENNILLEQASKEQMQEMFEKLLSHQTAKYPDKLLQCC